MSLDSTYIHTDVTAVALYDDFILAGIGSSMYVYSTKSTKPLQRLICLRGQKIYGFKRNECSIIVFGGKQMTLILGPHKDCIEDDSVFKKRFDPVMCDDWLHSVAWTAEGTEVSVLTAHNVVQKYDSTTLSLTSRHSSSDNSILYSGLLLPLDHDVLVMAGTVYSEVIIHVCGDEEPLHRLTGHKGVIFSISCLPEKNIIVTTSDDRSVRIWGQNCTLHDPWNTKDHWKREIVCKYELYGHFARVMRSSITDTHIVSVGEDSRVCFWSHDGVLDRRVKRHQNAGIWSIDTQNQLLITGGGDGAVTVQSYSPENNYHNSDVLDLEIGKPKHISYSSFHNLFILTESNRFIYYDTKGNMESDCTIGLEFNATFHTFSVSPNKLMCAIAGRKSIIQIATEVLKVIDGSNKVTVEFKSVKLEGETILSVHWAGDDYLVACSEKGVITVFTVTQNTVELCSVFVLPNCKERWLTCAANSREVFVFGDRCGGIHIYKKGSKHPLKSFSKIHGRYGPTSISMYNDNMITTGRDRTIKYFQINGVFKLTGTKELDFHWIERFLDADHKIVCGFREKMFIVFSLKTNETLIEIPCGGGHRSWDVRYKAENDQLTLKLMYLKNSNVNTESVGISMPVSVALGSHSKEINCLKSHQFEETTVFVSGGEDTTLRVSTLDSNMVFEDINICKNLSSVRTIKICKEQDDILVISAGGRAQICIRFLKFIKTNDKIEVKTTDLIDYMLKGTDKERKGDKNWKNVSKDSEPETRIMDLDYIKNNEKYTIFVGCSDARVRVFLFDAENNSIEMIKESEYLPTCILKTVCVNLLNHDVLITCSTRGDVAFWNAIDADFKPFFVTKTNKSGINSIVTNIIDNQILIATGGDDNALHINVLTVPDQYNLSSMQVQHSLVLDKHHSSAITGMCLVQNFILTTSIDQRITLYKWKVTDQIACEFLYQTYSDVADIKGMDVISQKSSSLTMCVYGKGFEVFDIPTDHT